MLKKLIFTFAVLTIVLVVSFKLEQESKLKNKTVENLSAAQIADIPETLKQEEISSIVILTHNDGASVRDAEILIADLRNEQKIKVLAFEIYNKDTSPERLIEIAYAKGEPDIFYVNGKLVEPKIIADFVRNILNMPEKK